MKNFYSLISILFFVQLIMACSSTDINIYKDNEPKLILNEFFEGNLTAHGIVKNRSNNVIRHFNVSMKGSWSNDGTGTLVEHFVFDDNSTQQRTWTFKPIITDEGKQYLAHANDTLEPVLTDISGNAFFMNYDLLINYKGHDIYVNIDDKMYLVNDSTIINESVMTKYGIEVGYFTLTIIKSPSLVNKITKQTQAELILLKHESVFNGKQPHEILNVAL